MADWPTTTVDAVSLAITKGTTPTTLGARFEDSGINFVKVESLDAAGRINSAKLAFIDEETHALLKRSVLQADDILFSIAGTIGRVARVQEADLPANTNQAVAIIRPNLRLVDRDYLFYCLRDGQRIAATQTRVVQSVQQNLSLGELGNIEIPLPTIEEQRGIAKTLGALDGKIESNRRMAATTSALVDALAEDLLSAVGTKSVPLSEVVVFNRAQVKAGSTPGVDYIDIASVSPGRIDATQRLAWSEAPSRARRAVADGDVIFSTVRPNRRAFSLILEPSTLAVASTGFAVITPTRRIGSSLLASVAASPAFAEYLESVAQGSAYPAVSIDAMGKFVVAVPLDESEVEAFEQRTMPLRRRTALAEIENGRLGTLRDALLPELLSGRIRVATKTAETPG
jgi:type I restriction enzyme, S subunit